MIKIAVYGKGGIGKVDDSLQWQQLAEQGLKVLQIDVTQKADSTILLSDMEKKFQPYFICNRKRNRT